MARVILLSIRLRVQDGRTARLTVWDLAAYAGVSASTVQKYLPQLDAEGFIRWNRRTSTITALPLPETVSGSPGDHAASLPEVRVLAVPTPVEDDSEIDAGSPGDPPPYHDHESCKHEHEHVSHSPPKAVADHNEPPPNTRITPAAWRKVIEQNPGYTYQDFFTDMAKVAHRAKDPDLLIAKIRITGASIWGDAPPPPATPPRPAPATSPPPRRRAAPQRRAPDRPPPVLPSGSYMPASLKAALAALEEDDGD